MAISSSTTSAPRSNAPTRKAPPKPPAPKPPSKPPERSSISSAVRDKPTQNVLPLTNGLKENFGSGGNDWQSRLPANLRKHAGAFAAAGEKFGVDPRFLAAVSMHETANGNSSAFRNKNNAMGIMGSSRTTKSFPDVQSSIMSQASSLKNNPAYAGRNTVEQIGERYAPVGAHNDAKGLNNHWVGGVNKNLAALGGQVGEAVK